MFEKLLQEKQTRWDAALEDAAVRMQDLSYYFSGNAPLVRCRPNQQLERWFASISQKVEERFFAFPPHEFCLFNRFASSATRMRFKQGVRFSS
jgi:hypothetical protein